MDRRRFFLNVIGIAGGLTAIKFAIPAAEAFPIVKQLDVQPASLPDDGAMDTADGETPDGTAVENAQYHRPIPRARVRNPRRYRTFRRPARRVRRRRNPVRRLLHSL